MIGISLVAVDLDGTLLTSEKTLAPEGARLLAQAARRGVHVVIATTRNPDYAREVCQQLAIREPIICTNGAQVWGSPDGPVWARYAMPQEVGLFLARLADERNWELSITVGSVTYWRQRPGQALGQVSPYRTIVAHNADAVVGDVLRILAWDLQAIEAVRLLCETRFAAQCRTETFYRADGSVNSLGVFAPEANKGHALDLVLQRLGLGPEQAMAIGDNLNDLPMFAGARISVALDNAPLEVKRKATAVAPSNDEEGVAWALRAFGLC